MIGVMGNVNPLARGEPHTVLAMRGPPPHSAGFGASGARLATKTGMHSLGFNVDWEVNDALDLSFDAHNSTAESQPDSPYGSAGVLGVAAFVRGKTTVDYSGDLPIINLGGHDGSCDGHGGTR